MTISQPEFCIHTETKKAWERKKIHFQIIAEKEESARQEKLAAELATFKQEFIDVFLPDSVQKALNIKLEKEDGSGIIFASFEWAECKYTLKNEGKNQIKLYLDDYGTLETCWSGPEPSDFLEDFLAELGRLQEPPKLIDFNKFASNG